MTAGEWLVAEGWWVRDKEHGLQFKASMTKTVPVLWTWIDVAGFHPQIAFYLDVLSLIMMLVVTFVSFLIHLYSAESMPGQSGLSTDLFDVPLTYGPAVGGMGA